MICSTTARLWASRRMQLTLPVVVMLIGCSNGAGSSADSGIGGSTAMDLGTPGTGGNGGGGGGMDAGSNPDAGPPPAPAAAVGYNTLTFGPQIKVGTTASPTTSYPQLTNGANWAPFTFYGTSWKDIGVVQNGDGSVTLDGSGKNSVMAFPPPSPVIQVRIPRGRESHSAAAPISKPSWRSRVLLLFGRTISKP